MHPLQQAMHDALILHINYECLHFHNISNTYTWTHAHSRHALMNICTPYVYILMHASTHTEPQWDKHKHVHIILLCACVNLCGYTPWFHRCRHGILVSFMLMCAHAYICSFMHAYISVFLHVSMSNVFMLLHTCLALNFA